MDKQQKIALRKSEVIQEGLKQAIEDAEMIATELSQTPGQQATASRVEQKKRKSAMRTQGRKGCKMTRLNLAMTPENHEFIKVLSKVTGTTMAKVVNGLIATYRKEHPELLSKANALLDDIQARLFENSEEE